MFSNTMQNAGHELKIPAEAEDFSILRGDTGTKKTGFWIRSMAVNAVRFQQRNRPMMPLQTALVERFALLCFVLFVCFIWRMQGLT
jgi:hypothetical protein